MRYALLLLVAMIGTAQASEEALWSKPVNGLRARLLVLPAEKPETPFCRVYIEFQNVSDVAGQMKIRFSPDKLALAVANKSGKALAIANGPYDGMSPLWKPMLLPYDGTLKFRISFPGLGYRPGVDKVIVDAGVPGTWVIPQDGSTCDLSGTLSIKKEQGDLSSQNWSGTLILPKVEIPNHQFASAGFRLLSDQGKPILTDADMIGYSWPDHTLILKPGVVSKLRAKLMKTGSLVSGVPFKVEANGTICYQGVFTSSLSSIPQSSTVINIDPIYSEKTSNERKDLLSITLGCPTEEFFRGKDPRGDPRIRAALVALGKLKNSDTKGSTASASPSADEVFLAMVRQAIKMPVRRFLDPYAEEQRPTGLNFEPILSLTGQKKDLENFSQDNGAWEDVINGLAASGKTWALASLLDHDNVDVKITAARALTKVADPQTSVALLAAAKANHYVVPGSENATLHSFYRKSLKEGLEKITGMNLTPPGLRVTVSRQPGKPQVYTSEKNPESFPEDVDFAKVETWPAKKHLPSPKPLNLTMTLARIADSEKVNGNNYLFVINGAAAFQTLDGLKKHLKDLPKGSTLTWSPGCCRMRGEPLLSSEEEMQKFKAFCESCGIRFVLVPSG